MDHASLDPGLRADCPDRFLETGKPVHAGRLNCFFQSKLIKMKWHGNTYIDISNIHSIHIFKTV